MSCSCAHVAIWVIDNRTSSWCRASFSVVCLECGGSQLVFMDAHSIFKGCRSKKAIQNRSKFKQIYDLQLKKKTWQILRSFILRTKMGPQKNGIHDIPDICTRQKLGPRAQKRPEPFWPGDTIGLRWHAISTPIQKPVKTLWDNFKWDIWWWNQTGIPSGYVKIAIENGHW
jgi:hypothetical protein